METNKWKDYLVKSSELPVELQMMVQERLPTLSDRAAYRAVNKDYSNLDPLFLKDVKASIVNDVNTVMNDLFKNVVANSWMSGKFAIENISDRKKFKFVLMKASLPYLAQFADTLYSNLMKAFQSQGHSVSQLLYTWLRRAMDAECRSATTRRKMLSVINYLIKKHGESYGVSWNLDDETRNVENIDDLNMGIYPLQYKVMEITDPLYSYEEMTDALKMFGGRGKSHGKGTKSRKRSTRKRSTRKPSRRGSRSKSKASKHRRRKTLTKRKSKGRRH